MDIFRKLKHVLLTPMTLMLGALDDFDAEELMRIVDKRTARAEAAVIRDYLAQHGLEGDEAQTAQERYNSLRRDSTPTQEALAELRSRAESAEHAARKAAVDAQARIRMARLGVPEQHLDDVLLLASNELRQAINDGGDADAVSGAIDAVIARIPSLAQPQTGVTTGTRGNFPRTEDAAMSLQHQLEQARAAGDNAAAVSIITGAASRGIVLR